MGLVRNVDARYILDESLRSSGLSTIQGVEELLRRQVSQPDAGKMSDSLLQQQAQRLWHMLDDLRSASDEHTAGLTLQEDEAGDSREWKLKEDGKEHRVMYRRGPEGTPLHTLCVEGLIHAPLSNVLCVSWEVPYFKEWWPQFTVPPFKILESQWVKRLLPGKDISSLKFKVPWPLATREVMLVEEELEYLDAGLVLVLFRTVPDDARKFNRESEGFEFKDIPRPGMNVVRLEVTGGLALQQLSPDCTYFRGVGSIDLKLDLVPASVINFMTVQLTGSAFKLFQKVSEDVHQQKTGGQLLVFDELLKNEPLYQHVDVKLKAVTAHDRRKGEEVAVGGGGVDYHGDHGEIVDHGTESSEVVVKGGEKENRVSSSIVGLPQHHRKQQPWKAKEGTIHPLPESVMDMVDSKGSRLSEGGKQHQQQHRHLQQHRHKHQKHEDGRARSRDNPSTGQTSSSGHWGRQATARAIVSGPWESADEAAATNRPPSDTVAYVSRLRDRDPEMYEALVTVEKAIYTLQLLQSQQRKTETEASKMQGWGARKQSRLWVPIFWINWLWTWQ